MSEEIEKHILIKYEIIQKLGKGAYGVVWKAKDRKSQKVLAIKKVFFKCLMEGLRCISQCHRCLAHLPRSYFFATTDGS